MRDKTPYQKAFGSYSGPFLVMRREKSNSKVPTGEIVFLMRDDNTLCPDFRSGNNRAYLYLDEVHPIKIDCIEELEVYCMLYPNIARELSDYFYNLQRIREVK